MNIDTTFLKQTIVWLDSRLQVKDAPLSNNVSTERSYNFDACFGAPDDRNAVTFVHGYLEDTIAFSIVTLLSVLLPYYPQEKRDLWFHSIREAYLETAERRLILPTISRITISVKKKSLRGKEAQKHFDETLRKEIIDLINQVNTYVLRPCETITDYFQTVIARLHPITQS